MNDYLKDALSDPQDPLAAITGFGSRLNDLNNSASGSVDTVADDLRNINSKFNEVSNTVLAAISAAGNPASVISDGSQGNIDKITLGKTSACTNSGTVSGDVNTGGIAGSIAIEYELDPEDDVSANLDGEYRRPVRVPRRGAAVRQHRCRLRQAQQHRRHRRAHGPRPHHLL